MDTIMFWKPDGNWGVFSQWYYSEFVCDGMMFTTAEQYMMYSKAIVFNDYSMAENILTSPCAHPNEHRKMGRNVTNFDEKVWNENAEKVVIVANLCKFTQNATLRNIMLDTRSALLVEASPTDRIWGIGYDQDSAAYNIENWGLNKLGNTLMHVRSVIHAMQSGAEYPRFDSIESVRTVLNATGTPVVELFEYSQSHALAYPVRTVGGITELFEIRETVGNSQMDALIAAGWKIISSWVDNVQKYTTMGTYATVNGISFRMGSGKKRLVVKANIDVYIPEDYIANIDSDMPGSKTGLVPTMTNELWLTKLASIAGYGTGSNGKAGLTGSVDPPPLTILGLDIEQTTNSRNGNLPLSHDDLISISITNGAWYDNSGPDVCYCIYNKGICDENRIVDGRKPVYIKAGSSSKMVEIAHNIVNMVSPDFVSVHNGFGFDYKRMSVHSANSNMDKNTYERRRLGNSRSGMFCRFKNGTMPTDTMFYVDKYMRAKWDSISLAHMAEVLDLPPKLDADEMKVEITDTYDVTDMLVYNVRDSDLHAWVAKETRMCELLYVLAGITKSTIWDTIAGNTGLMVYCLEASLALSMNMSMDLSGSATSDEREFAGGFVFEPKPGCYKGVIVIDGNSLYGSIMSKLGIFIDRCAAAPTARELAAKVGRDVAHELGQVEVGDVVQHENLILMRTETEFMCVIMSETTLLSTVLDWVIDYRKVAKKMEAEYKKSDNKTLQVMEQLKQTSAKLVTVSGFGSLGGRHGTVSSITCAMIVTYCARRYLKYMMQAATQCGFETIYGDTDSIFVHVKSETEIGCMTAGLKIAEKIRQVTSTTVFKDVGADVKGNYKSIVISAKKKYEGVNWDGSLDTKGLAIVKKDSLPIVKYTLTRLMGILNNDDTPEQRREHIISLVGKVMLGIQDGKLPISAQVMEVRLSGQPHLVYVEAGSEKKKAILVGAGIMPTNVSKKWVAKRVMSAIDSVLVPVGMNNCRELLFAYESRRRVISKLDKPRKSNTWHLGPQPGQPLDRD